MAVDLLTKRVPASEAAIIVPPATPVLVPGRAEDIAKLDQVKSNYPLWHTHLSGPKRSRQEEEWYWSLLGVAGDGLGMHPNTLHFELRFLAGKIQQIIQSDLLGTHLKLTSTTQMDHDEYHAYVVLAVDILFSRYLPEIRRQDIYQRVLELTGIRR